MAQKRPNVVLIYVDDLGYGDLSSYGATKIKTPHLDQLAKEGIQFTNGHSTSATCTPSRYGLMTGEYPWRKSGTGVLPGDAALIIPEGITTLPALFQRAGYRTGVVGKWHLGLGTAVEKDWNAEITPGPNERGFDYSFLFPATADRVPTVFMENGRVLGLDPSDPIQVDYAKKVGLEPTGKENPELLKMKASPNHGHDNTIVNGIGRIGYMSGGTKARWTDEEVPLTFLQKAKDFMGAGRDQPFFLFYSLTEPHVPRMPSTFFKGKSGLGYRGDVILQMDWAVGEIRQELERLGLAKNTLIIFTSDNGPVLNDGYEDEAVTKQNGHLPAGPLRGGKYSAFEGGTRVPFIVAWPRKVKPAISDALVSQVDLVASFSAFLRQPLAATDAPDSENLMPTLLGKSSMGREVLVQQGGALALVKGNWKYIEPNKGPALNTLTNLETGNAEAPQLYDLSTDQGETQNLAQKHPEKVQEMAQLLQQLKQSRKTR
ncbi:arylsulfatase [Rufibacter glacialis]|uniref:Arylsulfatase n=1 Tax=Rufibacter glacialis TaxID=1259555 RepID=A0A5M8QIJ3_9BACT|nr:arylsulfatase [Rufibacter glacialis]KAA6434794.1 sulfatase-like hydrolase/transferase [Rufibacter glacialis]